MLLTGIKRRSDDVFTGIAPDSENALHIRLAEGESDDHIGCHDHEIWVTEIKIIFQPYHHGKPHPSHQENPGPAAHSKETQQDDDQPDGKDQIQQAFKDRLTVRRQDAIQKDRLGLNFPEEFSSASGLIDW